MNFETTNLAPTVGAAPPLTDLLTVFKALSDPTRLAIIEHLAAEQHCVCELQEALELPANLLSHHLRVLREAGLVRDQRRGRWIDYALEPSTLHTVQTALAGYQTLITSETTTNPYTDEEIDVVLAADLVDKWFGDKRQPQITATSAPFSGDQLVA